MTAGAVGVPQGRKFLGFTLTGGKYPNRLKISSESIKRFRAQVRKLTRRNCGISIEGIIFRLSRYIVGWRGYYGYCEAVSVLRDLDSWLRRRLRCVQWKQWKIYKRRMSELIRFGVNEELARSTAWSARGPWKISHTPGVRIALNNRYFDATGLPRLVS